MSLSGFSFRDFSSDSRFSVSSGSLLRLYLTMLITPPLTTLSPARTDNTNDLRAILKARCMGNQDDQTASHRSYRLPAVLSVLKTVLSGQMKRIIKNQSRFFEPDSVLTEIRFRFDRVPLKFEFRLHAKSPFIFTY